MKSLQRPILRMLAVALPMMLLAACGEDEAKPPAAPETAAVEPAPAQENAPPPPPPELNEELRYSGETPEGETFTAQMGGDVALPSNLPEDFPLYPGGKVHSAMEAGDRALVTIDLPDDGRTVYRFYIDELRKGGWGVSNQMNVGTTHALTANSETYQAVIQIQENANGSRVAIAFTPHG